MSFEPLFRKRRLPHWDVPEATYFVTACLAGSFPAAGLLELLQYRRLLEERPCPVDMDETEWEIQKHKLIFGRFDRWLDHKTTIRHLEDHRLAAKIRESIYHFAGERYDVYAYVVMPSHFHWIFRPKEDWVRTLNSHQTERRPREIIMHTLKLHTATECNRLLGQKGHFWQAESYDHCVRSEAELSRIIEYIEMNPVKANYTISTEEWPFSSAKDRREWNIGYGVPLSPLR